MIPDFTKEQLAQLAIAGDKPLVICDVDEVVVHFTRGFEDYLAERQLWLDVKGFALNGSVKRTATQEALADHEVSLLIDQFFHDKTAVLEPIDEAVASLHALSADATVVLLTNLPHHARGKRITNMVSLGLHFPVVTNSGPKGPAIAHLAAQTRKPVVFIDDSPNFILSARQHAPHVHLVHFLHDHRFAKHHDPFPFASLTASHWSEARPHIANLLD